MTAKKEHWRKMAGKEFLIGEEFAGKEVKMTIKNVAVEKVQNKDGKKDKIVATFEQTDRKIILNVTNCKVISKLVGSGYPADWIGHEITFITERVTAFGETSDAIRVKRDYSKITPR